MDLYQYLLHNSINNDKYTLELIPTNDKYLMINLLSAIFINDNIRLKYLYNLFKQPKEDDFNSTLINNNLLIILIKFYKLYSMNKSDIKYNNILQKGSYSELLMKNTINFMNTNKVLCMTNNKDLQIELKQIPLLIKNIQISELLNIDNVLKNKVNGDNSLKHIYELIIENIVNKHNYNNERIKKIIDSNFLN